MGRIIVVVLRGPSTARIREGEPRLGVDVTTPVGPARFTYDTLYEDRGFESLFPRAMWLEVRGEVDDGMSFKKVIETYANVAAGFLPLIATAANIDVGEPETHLALDVTPDQRDHEFFQSFVPGTWTTRLRQGRRIDVPATVALERAIEGHDRTDRLRRALVHYRECLRYWQDGKETLSVSHLWMAVEALTKVALQQEIKAGIHEPEDDLCAGWGINKAALDSEVRRRVILHGDHKVARKLNQASNGWEHSFMDLSKVRRLSKEVRDKAARHVRAAILELSGVEQSAISALLAPAYEKPMPTMPLTKYVWGTFHGDADRLAPDGKEYPVLHWSTTMTQFKATPEGLYNVSFKERFTLECGEGVTFDANRYEVWGAPTSSDVTTVDTHLESGATRPDEPA